MLPNLRTAFFILVSSLLLAAPATSQSGATPSREATPDTIHERQLSESRRRREDAQVEYYQALTKKLQQADPPKTFWRALSDNAAILGALTAAMVALFTLVVNQRTALQARKDTEFYEALKRFGDKDSPTVRASAVAMLAEMSNLSVFAWRWRKDAPPLRPDLKMIRYPYFETVLDQLITGYLIEENPVVVYSIVVALKRILPINKNILRAAERLSDSNRRFQEDIKAPLTELFGASGATKPDAVEEELWKQARNLTRCSPEGLEALVRGYWSWEKTDPMTDLRRIEINTKLKDVGRCLNQNVQLCEMLLNLRSISALDSLSFFGAYLPNVTVLSSDLRNIDFGRALMPQASLMGSRLGGANFQDAVLEGILFKDTELTDTRLYGARIDSFLGNWWRADYREHWHEELVDEGLIEKYILSEGELSPEQLKEAHPSVKRYVAKRNASRDDAATKQ